MANCSLPENIKGIYDHYKSSFEQPKSLETFIDTSLTDSESYAAVFVPGGHGAMLGLPEDENVSTILNWVHEKELFTVTLCHGPAVLLATTLNDQAFLYDGYNMAVFPDSVDKQTPMIGYLPGKMPSAVSEKLKELGATLMNTKSDDTVCVDRKLITGASPLAANALGKLAAETLLEALK